MKNKLLLAAFVFALALTASQPIGAYDPPKGLQWGMSYGDVENVLVKVHGLKPKQKWLTKKLGRELREYSELAIADGFKRFEFGKAKLLGKKADKTYTIFDDSSKFVAFHQIFKWKNDLKNNKGFRKAWVFHSDLKDALTTKYGAPIIDETHEGTRATNIPSGTKLETTWTDSIGSSINLIITRQTHNAMVLKIDRALVFLLYELDASRISPGNRHKDGFDSGDI